MKYGFVALLIAVASGAYAWAHDAGNPDPAVTPTTITETAPTASAVPATVEAATTAAPAAASTAPVPAATEASAETPVVAPVAVDASAPIPATAEAVAAEVPALTEPLPAPRAPEEDYKLTASLMAHDGLKVGAATKLTIKLSFPNQRKVRARDLLNIHGRPLHVYAVDESLTDYQHLQPKAAKSGKWVVKFTPKKAGTYRLFVEAAPLKGKPQLLPLILAQAASEQPVIDKSVTTKVEAEGYSYVLHFDEALKADSDATGHLNITDKYGRPITDLEPIMGSYAHIIGVSDDLETVTLTRPMGEMPKKRTQRGGPDIDFTIQPKRIGYMKLFVHTRAGGKDRVIAMGADVAQ